MQENGADLSKHWQVEEPPPALELANGKKVNDKKQIEKNMKNKKVVAYFSTRSLQVNDMSRLKPSSSRSHLGCFICMKRNLQLLWL